MPEEAIASGWLISGEAPPGEGSRERPLSVLPQGLLGVTDLVGVEGDRSTSGPLSPERLVSGGALGPPPRSHPDLSPNDDGASSDLPASRLDSRKMSLSRSGADPWR